ncbi:MAG: hypothetical protein ACR2MT_05890, partial [Aurantibacter sp.]
LPQDAVVEVPAQVDNIGLHPQKMERLPEPILAILRTQVSINKLLIESFDEASKEKLFHAILLEPTVDSYPKAVACMNEMLDLQKEVLPKFK